jgi:hypothetical protein
LLAAPSSKSRGSSVLTLRRSTPQPPLKYITLGRHLSVSASAKLTPRLGALAGPASPGALSRGTQTQHRLHTSTRAMAIVLPCPLQHLKVPAVSGASTRLPFPSAVLLPRPLQLPPGTRPRRPRGPRRRVPRAAVLSRPPQHLQVPAPGESFAGGCHGQPLATAQTNVERESPKFMLAPPCRRVIENKQSTEIGACLTLRVHAHTYTRTRFVASTSVECLLTITPCHVVLAEGREVHAVADRHRPHVQSGGLAGCRFTRRGDGVEDIRLGVKNAHTVLLVGREVHFGAQRRCSLTGGSSRTSTRPRSEHDLPSG